jgi:EmrB/QacA subfamily drug resistance transporter
MPSAGTQGGQGDVGIQDQTSEGSNPAIVQGKGSGYATKVLLTVTAVALMVNYVETMVIPGVPTIQKDFGTTASIASWITSAFLIVGSATSPLFGKMGDIYGKRKMFLVVLTFYTAGVGFAGFASSIYELLLARAIQGIGFAIVPLAIALITDEIPREKVATAQGIISGTFAIGATAGLVLGSYIVEDLGWRYAFYSAFILSLVLFALVSRVIRKDLPGQRTKMDYGGTALLMAGITLVLLYLTEGPTLGWSSLENLAFLLPGLGAVALFFVYESRHSNPMIQLSLLRIRNVLMANVIGIISGLAMFLIFFAVIYYAQLPKPYGLGMDIISTGLAAAPATVMMLIIGPLAGRMVTRKGPKPVLLIGSLAMIVGLSLFIVNRSTTLDLTLDIAIAMSGLVCTIIPIINMVALSLPKENIAVGLGINTMLRNLGGSIGPVVATTFMSSYVVSIVVNVGGHEVVVGQVPSSTAFDLIFITGIAIMAVAIVLSLLIKNYSFAANKKD